jgi:hypothetical protein
MFQRLFDAIGFVLNFNMLLSSFRSPGVFQARFKGIWGPAAMGRLEDDRSFALV